MREVPEQERPAGDTVDPVVDMDFATGSTEDGEIIFTWKAEIRVGGDLSISIETTTENGECIDFRSCSLSYERWQMLNRLVQAMHVQDEPR